MNRSLRTKRFRASSTRTLGREQKKKGLDWKRLLRRLSESKINNWYFLFKSYHQVNHLSMNRVEAKARKEVACGEQTLFSALVSPAIFRRMKKLGNQ